jgi:hypothetical protein
MDDALGVMGWNDDALGEWGECHVCHVCFVFCALFVFSLGLVSFSLGAMYEMCALSFERG